MAASSTTATRAWKNLGDAQRSTPSLCASHSHDRAGCRKTGLLALQLVSPICRFGIAGPALWLQRARSSSPKAWEQDPSRVQFFLKPAESLRWKIAFGLSRD